MMRTADELRCKIAKFKTGRMEETENSKKMRLDHQKYNFSTNCSTGNDSFVNSTLLKIYRTPWL